MASQIPNSSSFSSVLPYAQDHRSLLARIAILSRTKLILPKILETIFLILEYLQLISLDFFLNESIQSTSSSPPSALYDTLTALAKIVAPGYILQLEGKTASVFITISAIASIICLTKYALMLYTFITAAMRSEGKTFLVKAWGFVLNTQCRIGYFIMTSFWTKMLSSIFQNEALLQDNQRFYLTIWSIVMIILEFGLAFAIEIGLPCYLPQKSFLASKGNVLEIITLCQKLFLQIITVSQLPHSLAIAWVFNSINVITNTAKSFIFVTMLPFYKLNALFYQIILLVVVSSLSLAHLAFTLMRSVLSENFEINQNFTTITWALIAILWTYTAITGLKGLLFNLLTRWEELPDGLLVHKVVFLKELLNSTHEPIKLASNHTWTYLLAKSAVANLSTVLNLPPEAVADIKLESVTKPQLNGLISQYLDNVCRLKPKSSFLKLYQAFHYGKRLNLYGLSTSILLALRKISPSIGIEVSISLLMNKMSEILIAGYRIKNEKIDLYTFIQSQRIVTELKESIMQQAELQAKLCHEMNTNKANLLKVYTYSQKIVDWRTKIEQQSKSVLANIPDYHIEPLALCAHYHLVLNHSVEKYLKFYKEYSLKYQKYKSFFQGDLTCHENAYQRGNIFFVLAGRKEIVSQIMYASKEGWDYFGRDITGERAHKALNPSLQGFYQEALQATLERGDMRIMGAPIRCFHYSKQGFVTLDDFHMNISPLISRDLYYFGVVRRIPTSKEYLLINEDGTVESGTRKICAELGLLPSHPSATRTLYNVTQISDELHQAHLAFNMIAFPEKYQPEKVKDLDDSDHIEMEFPEERKKSYTLSSKGFKTRFESRLDLNAMDIEQANKIYSAYTTEGKNLRINRIKKTLGPPLLYNCKMENQVYGNVLLKVVTLDKGGAAIDDDDEEVIRRKYANTELYDEGDAFTFREKQREKKPSIELKSRQLKQSDTDLSDENETSHIVKENEKENGWIDFEKIHVSTMTMPANKHGQSFPTISQTQLLNQENPPSTNRGFLLNGDNPDATLDNDPIVKKAKILPVVHGEKSSPAQEGFSEARLAKVVNMDLGDKNSRMTHVSSSAIQQKISKVFHEAVKTKYYPKSYRVFLFMWYLLLTVVLVNQFRINLVGESEIRDFQVRKNILMDSNARSSVLPVLHMHVRSLWMIAQNASAYNLDRPSSDVINFTFEDVDELRTNNHKLMETASKINDDNRLILFEKDIRVFEPNSTMFLNVTNFQAVDQIVEKGYQSLTLAYDNIEEATPGFELILKNDLDDLLVKSDSISKIILAYTTESNQSTIQDRTINLILTVCGIIAMIVFFVVLVHKQYKKDLSNLHSFLRINKHGVKVVLNRVLQFKKIVQGGDNFDEIPESDIIRDYLKEFSKTRLQAKAEGNRDVQFLDSKGISRRFWFYLLQTVVILGVVTGVISVNQVISKNSLEENERKLYQLHFLGDMKLDTTIVFASIMDVKVDPDTPAFVRNKPILIDISDQIEHFTKMISKISDELQDSNSQYSPIVEEVLFQNLCAYVDDDETLTYCNSQLQAGRTSGLLETLNEMDLFFKDIIEQPTTIDIAQAFDLFVQRDFVIRSAIDTILDSLNGKFDDAIEANADMIITLNVSITISLILICIGVHFFVLRKVGECDNNFKRMLNTFPATLVLSNFMLKSFLLRTSKGTLDAVKDEI